MDYAENLTNSVCIHDLNSIPFAHLQLSNQQDNHPRLLQNIESKWRRQGLLVSADLTTHGLYIFGSAKESDPYDKIKSTYTVANDGSVNVDGQRLDVESRGFYDSIALLGRPRISATSPTNYMPRSKSAPQGSDNIIRAAQALNARAAQANMLLTTKQDSIPSPNSSSSIDSSGPDSGLSKILHEAFISSVLGLFATRLCIGKGYIPLNATTLLAPTSTVKEANADNGPGTPASMVSLDLQITAVGNLVLKAVPSIPSGLANIPHDVDIGNAYKGTTVWIAPGGSVATYMGVAPDPLETISGNAISTDIQIHQAQNSWKTKCLAWLSEKGVDSELFEDCSWSVVVVETCPWPSLEEMPQLSSNDNGRVNILWPTLLCFYRPVSGKSYSLHAGSAAAKFVTGSSSSINMVEDPLAFAENWANEKPERDGVVMKRQKDREVAAAAAKAQNDLDAKVAVSALSPIALRRSSVAGAVYPTPPDAIHHNTAATPSMDGTVSTPVANQATPANPSQQPSTVKDEPSDNSNDPWASSQLDISHNAIMLEENSNDNLFDDMGGDLFGENDITDADFNFFDEPDAAQNHIEDFLPDPPRSNKNIDTDMLCIEENGESVSERPIEPSFDIKATNTEIMTSDKTTAPAKPVIETSSANPKDQQPLFPSPAFDRNFVFSQIIPDFEKTKSNSLSTNLQNTSHRLPKHKRPSIYEKVALKPTLSFTSKYKESGPFQGMLAIRGNKRKPPTEIPCTGFLKKVKAPSKRLSEFFEVIQPAMIADPEQQNGMQEDRMAVDSDSDSSRSEPDLNAPFSAVQSHAGTKRKYDGEIKSGSASPKKIVAIQEKPEDGSATPTEAVFETLDANPADWSLANFYSYPQPSSAISLNLSNSNFIAAVQILADQAATWSSHRLSTLSDWPAPSKKEQGERESLAVKSQQDLSNVAKTLFRDAADCTLGEVMDIKDLPAPPQPTSKLPPRPLPPKSRLHDGSDPSEAVKKSPLIILPVSHLDLRRADTKMTVLPSALPFWENLALSPSAKEKDVTALCIYPNADGMQANVKALFQHLKSAYESSRMGTHEILEGTGQSTAQIPLARTAFEQLPSTDSKPGVMENFCIALGKQLASTALRSCNIVVYIVCPSESELAPIVICQAFHKLFEAYRHTLAQKKLKPQNELVLQMIPSSLVASDTELVIPAPKEYARLAMEVYDRCMNFKSMSKSSAVVLEQPLPKSLHFNVSTTPSVSLIDENSCIHIAYAQSIDERWITAAWSDNTGVQQMTASYCLGRRNEPLTRLFSEVANEIWETTLDVIRAKKIKWRIMIVKSGVMQQSEIDFWSDLASTEMHANILLTLLTVDTRPSLCLLPPSLILPPNNLSTQAGMLTTPVSTPQPNILSPDQFGNTTTPVRDGITSAATPEAKEAEFDKDSTLTDITEQTWAAILSLRLNNSNCMLDIAPALISGYLIKRTGPHMDDMPTLMEVNIVHIDAKDGMRSARSVETVFREILGYYKGLGTLARARGVVDQFLDVRPWHVAAAEKALKVLYMLM